MPFLAPIGAAIGAFIAANAVSIAATVLSVGLGLASALLTKSKLRDKDFALTGRQQTITSRNSVAPRRLVVGETRVGGTVIYQGTPVATYAFKQVQIHASHEVDAIGTVFMDDEPVYPDQEIGSTSTEGEGQWVGHGVFDDTLLIGKRLGTASQTAYPQFVNNTANEWTADHRFRGHAGLYFDTRWSEGAYPSGFPNATCVIRGAKCYDPRDAGTRWTDNAALVIRWYMTLPRDQGGFGAASDLIDDTSFAAAANVSDEIVASPTTGAAALMHTAKAPSSGTGIVDPAVDIAANSINVDGDRLLFQRGDRVVVASDGSLPGGLSAATPYYVIPHHEKVTKLQPKSADVRRLPALKFATSLANARAGVAIDLTSTGSGTITITKTGEPRWTINGSFTQDQAPQRILEELLAAMGARRVFSGGKYRLAGYAWAAPTLTLDESDLRGPLQVATKLSRRDRFNAVKGTHLSPQNDWQPSSYPAVTNTTYEAEDGERIWQKRDQPYVSRPGQCQRLAKLELVRARMERTVRMPCLLTAYNCRAGEVIYVNNARRAWVNKPFEVVRWQPVMVGGGDGQPPYLGIDLELRETSSAIYDWASSEESAAPPLIEPTLPNPFDIDPPGVPAIAEYLYEGRDGSDIKAVARMTWSLSGDGMTYRYWPEYQASGAADWIPLPPVLVPVENGPDFSAPALTGTRFADVFDIEPGFYLFRVRGESHLGTFSDWSTTSVIEIKGLAADPVAITGLTGLPLGGQFRLRWDLHADADVRRGGHIEFRHSPLTSGATADESTTIGDRVDGRSTTADLPFKAGTYFARAVDKLGHAGPWASVVNIGDTVLAWSTLGSIQEDATFPGTHSGTASIGSAITLDGASNIDSWGLVDDVLDWDTEGGVVASGTYTFSAGIDLGSVQRVRVRGHIRCVVANIRDLVDSRTGLIDTWESFDGDTAPGAADAWIEVRATNDDPAGSPVWSAWQRLEVAEFNARAFQFRAQLRSYDTSYRPEVSELRAFAEDPSI